MFSDSEPLWPYVFLAVGWSAACAYMLVRARKTGKPIGPPIGAGVDSESAPTSQSAAQWERDTQAGRM